MHEVIVNPPDIRVVPDAETAKPDCPAEKQVHPLRTAAKAAGISVSTIGPGCRQQQRFNIPRRRNIRIFSSATVRGFGGVRG